MKKLVSNAAIYTMGNVLPQALNFLLLPIYTRFMTPSEYGIVQSVTVLSSIFTILFTLAMERSLYRLYYDYTIESDRRKYLGTLFIAILLTSSIGVLTCFIFKKYIALIYVNIQFYPYYVYAIGISGLAIFQILPKIYFQVKEKAGSFLILSVIQMVIQTIFIVWQVIILKHGAIGMLKGLIYSNIILLPLFFILQVNISTLTFKKQIFYSSLKFSLPFIPGLIAAWIINMADRIFLERYFTLNEVGIYSLAFKINSILLLLTGGFFTAYSPHFYRIVSSSDIDISKTKIYTINTFFFLIILILGFIIILFSKEIVFLLFDKRYIDAYKVLPILCLGTIISQISGLFNLQLYQEKKTIQPSFLVTLGAIVTIAVNRMITPKYGMYGAAITQVITSFFLFSGVYYLAKKIGYFVPANWAKIVPMFIMLSTIFLLMIFFHGNIYLGLIIKLTLLGIMFLFILKKYYKIICNLVLE
jgi:O-antigen/teichoic acid export membrane protein